MGWRDSSYRAPPVAARLRQQKGVHLHFICNIVDFNTYYLIIACLVVAWGAELVGVVVFPERREEREEEEVALTGREQVTSDAAGGRDNG